ncbi:hypothetical protein OAM41_00505 [Gammaproteobacteria bacterium]|nr:hypothetical protein [Gammaproteobacteria bacterium]
MRNPYSWISAMHREPYYDHYPKIKDLSLESFVQFSIEDYENCIAMWNLKNDSYFRMSEEVPNSIIINVEDFHADQQKFHERMADVLNRKDFSLIKMNDYVNGRGWHEQKDISSSLQVPKLEKSLIKVINSFLSTEIMKKCNYKLLT